MHGMYMRMLIHGSEHPHHYKTFASILASFSLEDEGIFLISNQEATSKDFAPKNFFLHKLRDIFWDWFKININRYKKNRWDWSIYTENKWVNIRQKDLDKEFKCPPIKGFLPWRPDVVLCVSPHEGHTKYQLIPWAIKQNIPIISIDHGCPLVVFPFGNYRGSMMGCNANAVWGEFAAKINSKQGANRELQIITGTPTIDDIPAKKKLGKRNLKKRIGAKLNSKMVLLMTTHREPLKTHCDNIFQEICERYILDDNIEIHVKPHPVELRNNSFLKIDEKVKIHKKDVDLHALIGASDVIISPATSVIVPALAMNIPFVNLLDPNSGIEDAHLYSPLIEMLGNLIGNVSELHEWIKNPPVHDEKKIFEVFKKVGYKCDGKNGKRVFDLCKWASLNKSVSQWKDFDN